MSQLKPQPLPSLETTGPVDWALGKVLIETILKPIVYYLVPDRADPRDWMEGRRVELPPSAASLANDASAPTQDYWFDFLADTGDSESAWYSIAYLLHGDLAVNDPGGRLAGDEPSMTDKHEVVSPDSANALLLPRGAFLFVGGDTAYPVADSAAVKARFLAPMNHAFEQRFVGERPLPRPILGVPGNHDWYDSLDAFGRVFRRPTGAAAVPSPDTTKPIPPNGYFAIQSASYFSLELPGGWSFWAMDARDGGDVDFRQKAFFASVAAPRRLLLATPTPAVVNGDKSAWVDGLLNDALPGRAAAIRLWFSGDSHHYARYDHAPLTGELSTLSLVSGLGGAALHAPRPARRSGPIEAARVYPQAAEAARDVTSRLLSPLYMVSRPGLRWLGAALGALLGVSSLQTQGEVGPWITWLLTRDADAPPLTSLPVVLVALLVTIAWLVPKVRSRPAESTARKTKLSKRVAVALRPGMFLALLLTVVSLLAGRSLGSIVLDLGFELALVLLLVALPYYYVSGQFGPPWKLRALALAALGVAHGASMLGLAIATARIAGLAGEHLAGVSCLPRTGSLLTTFAVAAMLGVVFPVVSGFALALAFSLGTQQMSISSFAAIDRFQAFIRFRLRTRPGSDESTLTGFVIAVTRPVSRATLANPTSPEALKPEAKLLDVFTVR